MIRRVTRQPRVLLVIGALFCASALARLAPGMSEALAQENPALSEPAVMAPVDDATAAPDAPSDAARFLRLSERAQALDSREAEIAARESALAQATEALRAQLATLESAEAELEATMALADRAALDDIDRLARVFEAMKPDEAAAVFAEMDPTFAAGFLGRIAPEAAASILAGLEPRQAYAFSALLAGRNALVPTSGTAGDAAPGSE